MDSLSPAAQPRVLLRLWTLLLLAPCAWAAALGALFSLTNDACLQGSRGPMWWAAIGSAALSAAPLLPALAMRRRFPSSTAEGERARFMLEIAIGGSLLFTVVTALATVPIALLDTCRT